MKRSTHLGAFVVAMLGLLAIPIASARAQDRPNIPRHLG